jgi:hypothetical protein
MNWLQTLLSIVDSLWLYRWEIAAIIFIIWHRKTVYKDWIFTPLAGGNGKIQIDELVKGILVIMIIRASDREGASTEQAYPDIYWIMIFSAIFAIAALKVPINKAFSNFNKKSEPTQTSTETL